MRGHRIHCPIGVRARPPICNCICSPIRFCSSISAASSHDGPAPPVRAGWPTRHPALAVARIAVYVAGLALIRPSRSVHIRPSRLCQVVPSRCSPGIVPRLSFEHRYSFPPCATGPLLPAIRRPDRCCRRRYIDKGSLSAIPGRGEITPDFAVVTRTGLASIPASLARGEFGPNRPTRSRQRVRSVPATTVMTSA